MPILRIDNKAISTPLLTIIKDIKRSIHNGKLAVIKDMGDNIRVSCVNPHHKGGHESRPSADIYIGEDTKEVKYSTYSCFTCGMTCSFEHFVAMAFDQSDSWAKKWLIENYADNILEDELPDLPVIELQRATREYLDESILNSLENFHPYMLKRKLSRKVIEAFKVKYDSSCKCLVFPVYDEHEKLFMLTRRSVEDKTFIIDKNKEKPLYLLYYLIKENLQTAMIAEGQIDCLTAWGYGMPCIATMGAISDHQIDLINKSGIRTLYIMFDNDEAGTRFKNKLLSKIRKDILVIPVSIIIPGKKDINDLSEDEFWKCVEYSETNCII